MSKLQRLFDSAQACIYGPKNTKMVVLGHQKTGTTAIGNLLANAVGLSFSNDPIYWIEPSNALALDELIRNPEHFLQKRNRLNRKKRLFRAVVKDPDYILALDTVFKLYPAAKFLFIARNPAQVIRSIFNRLKLQGTSEARFIATSDMYRGTSNWSYVLNGEGETDRLTVVERLAARIEKATEKYIQNQSKLHLVKYEDFSADKLGIILALAESMGFQVRNDISAKLDIAFQPKGNANLSLLEFFGEDNIARIQCHCPKTLHKFGYTI